MQKIDKNKMIHWLESELQNTKGVEVSNRLDWLDYCLFIFEENYKELDSYSISTEKPNMAIEMFKDRDYSSLIQGQLVRHLHNFLVSSKSLVEHTRRSIRKWYEDTDFMEPYQQRIDSEFVGNPLSSFIEDLRHYCVHRSPIDIITYHNFGNDKITNTSYIKKDSLVQWKSISSGSKKYLTNYEKDIPVMEPITAYKDKVVEFRKWLKRELMTYHKKEIYESKWYVQAINYARKGDYAEIFKSAGIFNIPEQFQK